MDEYLIGLMYHYPKDYELWNKGVIEDYEASTGIFIKAEDVNKALKWGHTIATALLNHVHETDDLTLEKFQHDCWYIAVPKEDSWSHCLDFFQHVADGQMPVLAEMTTDAFVKWQKKSKN